MEKKDIVARFLKDGQQLDAGALDYFKTNPEKMDEFLMAVGRAAGPQTPTITLGLVRSVLGTEVVGPAVKIIKKFSFINKRRKISISDYSNSFVNSYEVKKQMLINRVDSSKLLSINKIQKQKEFVLISMIREKDEVEKSATVEDTTGNTMVYFGDAPEFKTIFENDVIAIICEQTNVGIMGRSVVWPDIPLKRTVNKTKEDARCLFISDFHMDSKQFNRASYRNFVKWVEAFNKTTVQKRTYVFILGGISKNKSDIENLLNLLPRDNFKIFLISKNDAAPDSREDLLYSDTPIMVEIEGIKILLCQGDNIYRYSNVFGDSPTDVMTALLKRRDLHPPIGLGPDPGSSPTPLKESLIDHIPDIFASGSFHSPTTTNYKGVTIITTGSLSNSPIFWSADLRTREINKLSFS